MRDPHSAVSHPLLNTEAVAAQELLCGDLQGVPQLDSSWPVPTLCLHALCTCT